MSQLIDQHTGAVRLEKGLILTPGQTPDELIQLVGARATGSFGKNTWYSDIRMETEFGVFMMGLFFKKESLSSFTASLVTGYGPPSALVKTRHDEMLTRMLGRPMEQEEIHRSFFNRLIFKSGEQSWHKHTKVLRWKFPWGVVTSGIDPREGSAQMKVAWK